MKTAYLCLFFFCITCVIDSIAQDTRLLNADSLQHDFEILYTSLLEKHPMAGMYDSRTKFDSVSAVIRARIQQGLTRAQFRELITVFISRVGCGHTYVYPEAATQEAFKIPNDLPFEVRIVGESVYVSKVYVDIYKPYLYRQIKSINQVPVTHLLALAHTGISADGYNITYKNFRLQQQFDKYLQLMLPHCDSLIFECNPKSFVIPLPTRFTKAPEVDSESSFGLLPSAPSTVLLTLADFDGGKRLIKKCFTYIDRNHVQNLIIDLRNNGGGNGNIGALLTSYLVDSSTTYYLDEKTHRFTYTKQLHDRNGILISNHFTLPDSTTKSYYFTVRPRKKHHFNGKLYLLINGGTFSTAAYVASVLAYKTPSYVVGDESGGSAYALGGGVIATLTLPYSQTDIKFPLYRWRYGISPTGRGVMPNSKVSDIPSPSDPVLEHTVGLIRSSH